MEYDIEKVLGDQYLMFYHPGLPVKQFKPVQSLRTCIEVSNELLESSGRDFSQWDPRFHDTIARIMNANWICNRLEIEPIRKPLLVHREHNQFVVDCGDTRVMALSALPNPPTLSTVITTKKQNSSRYQEWIPVRNNYELTTICGFDPEHTAILLNPCEDDNDWCLTWLEIGDRTTMHHLHDVNARVAMLQNWIRTQTDEFRFSIDWIRQPIDWTQYRSTE